MRDRKKFSISAKQLAVDGMLTTLLVVLSWFKLPSLIPGAEFQISSPYAVCLAAGVGFKRYLGIGICASLIQLMLGTHTIWNVVVAMVFRIVVGLIITYFPGKRPALILAGPLGTGCARVVLAAMLHVPTLPLIAAAAPGMVFTAVCVAILEPILKRVFAQYQMAFFVSEP